MLKQPRRKINVYNFHLINLLCACIQAIIWNYSRCVFLCTSRHTVCVYLKDLLNFFALFNSVTRVSVQMRRQQGNATHSKRVFAFSLNIVSRSMGDWTMYMLLLQMNKYELMFWTCTNFTYSTRTYGVFYNLRISVLFLWRICWTWELASLWMCVCVRVWRS